jgi:hypothetical protein
MITSIESDCSEQGDLTELTPIWNSVHTSNDRLQRRRVPLSGVTNLESGCCVQVDMTEMTPKVDIVHTSNDSLQRRRVPLIVVTSIDSDCREQGDMTEMTLILNSVSQVQRQLALAERATQDGHQVRNRL